MFGSKSEVDPVAHLIGTATAWGGNPPSAAVFKDVFPTRNDGATVHSLVVKDVPVDGFWSISVYNAKGYFEKNFLDRYSISSLTARPNIDGSITVQFGGCEKSTPNCLPIMSGWNYTVRMYRPRKAILDGSWQFPGAVPVRSTTHPF
jgi:para-nitrobenzyl esterase